MVAVVAAVGCGQDPVLVCEDASIPAVTVVVRDSVTNAPIPQGLEMVGILRDGAFTEPMGRAGSPALAGKTVRLSAESRAVGIAMTYSRRTFSGGVNSRRNGDVQRVPAPSGTRIGQRQPRLHATCGASIPNWTSCG